MSKPSVMERLAEKLAAANLTEDEVELLRELIAPAEDVLGYGARKAPDRAAWFEIITNATFARESGSGMATGFTSSEGRPTTFEA